MAYNNEINNTILGTFNVGNMTIDPGTGVIEITELETLQSDLDTTYGKLYFTRDDSDSGTSNYIYIYNTSTDASSDVLLSMILDSKSSGDVTLRTGERSGGITAYSAIGIDNSATGDPLQIVSGGTLGTDPYMNFASSGEVTQATKPAFLTYLASTQSNQTGNATTYNPLTSGTEVFDIGSNLSGGVFTAPVNGKFHFIGSCYIGDITNATYAQLALVTTAGTYMLMSFNPQVYTASNGIQLFGSIVLSLTAGNTAYLQVMSSGEGSDANDIAGASTLVTYFSGFLVG